MIFLFLGSLTVARAFGDFFLKSSRYSIISSKPDIRCIERPINQSILIASDGVWECGNNECNEYFTYLAIKKKLD